MLKEEKKGAERSQNVIWKTRKKLSCGVVDVESFNDPNASSQMPNILVIRGMDLRINKLDIDVRAWHRRGT